MGRNAKFYKRATRKEKEKLKISKNSIKVDNSLVEQKLKKIEERQKKRRERLNKKQIDAEKKDNQMNITDSMDDIENDTNTTYRQMQQQRKMTSVEKHEQKYPGLKGRTDYVDLLLKKKTYTPAVLQ